MDYGHIKEKKLACVQFISGDGGLALFYVEKSADNNLLFHFELREIYN